MPTLRVYLDAYFDNDLRTLEAVIAKDPNNFAQFNEYDEIIQPGFFKVDDRVFQETEGIGYLIANYFRIETKNYPSKNSELYYFNFIEDNQYRDEKKYSFPMLIKILINKNKGIMCFYSKKLLTNEAAAELSGIFQRNLGFNFKYSLVNNHHKFKKNTLDNFLLSLSDFNNFTEIGIYDEDNKLIAKNENILQETEKVEEFQEQVRQGNWEYVKLINDQLDFEIRLTNRIKQHHLTFINNYKEDAHLVRCADYLILKIRETIELDKRRQTSLDWFSKK